jgi:hypothetical protein
VLEIIIDHPVWKSFPANTDSFKDTVTSQLVHDQGSVKNSRLLVRVGNDTSERNKSKSGIWKKEINQW